MYLIAWNIGSGWLYIIVSLMIAFPLASLVICHVNIRQLGVDQSAAPESINGGGVESVISIINRSPAPHFFFAVDSRFGGSRKQFFLPSIGGRQTLERPLEFAPLKRGIYPGAEVVVTSGAPMGLVKCRRKMQTSCPLAVYPTWHNLSGDWRSSSMHAGVMRSSNAPTRTASSDYLGVRDYRSGDSPRSIHWRTSARNSRLAVIEYARQAVMSPVFILDTWKGFSRNDVAFESAVSVMASLVMREAANGRRFGIGSSANDAAVRDLGHDSEAAMFWLAGIEPQADAPLDLEETLPWPDATPVLLLSSHVRYHEGYGSVLLDGHPHAIVIIFDIRGFGSPGVNAANLMNNRVLGEFVSNLDRQGSRAFVIGNSENLVPCLHRL